MLDRTDTARLGHNGPPSPIEIATSTTAEVSRWMADHPAIQAEDHARAGKVLVDRAKASLDEMDAERDDLVRPLNEEVKAINDRYRPARTSLEKLADELKKRLSTYARALETSACVRRRKRKAAEEAERAARKAEQREREAIEDADQGVCDVDLGAATLEADTAFAAFRKADNVAARAERDSHIRIAGGFGKAMGLRDRDPHRHRLAGRDHGARPHRPDPRRDPDLRAGLPKDLPGTAGRHRRHLRPEPVTHAHHDHDREVREPAQGRQAARVDQGRRRSNPRGLYRQMHLFEQGSTYDIEYTETVSSGVTYRNVKSATSVATAPTTSSTPSPKPTTPIARPRRTMPSACSSAPTSRH
jgi:hypothetical protein